MRVFNTPKYGVPISLIKDGQIAMQTSGNMDWKYDDITDHYAVAYSFISYVCSVRDQLLVTKSRNRKLRPPTADFDQLIIHYADQIVCYDKQDFYFDIPTPIAATA